LYEQLDQKDQSLSESWAQLAEARKEIAGQQDSVAQAETAIREYRAKMRKMEEDMQGY
jgi:predicted  nucleic acid-binding Zn-ribbon protein